MVNYYFCQKIVNYNNNCNCNKICLLLLFKKNSLLTKNHSYRIAICTTYYSISVQFSYYTKICELFNCELVVSLMLEYNPW